MSALSSNTLQLGDLAPPFTLPDIDGRLFDLGDVLEGGPLLLVFAPGTWSPSTRRQIADLEAVHDQLQGLGVTAILVLTEAAQQARHALGPLLRTTERSFLGPLLSFPILLDASRNTSRDYGVYRAWSRHGFRITRPAVFFVSETREIRFIYVGERDGDVPEMAPLLKLVGSFAAAESHQHQAPHEPAPAKSPVIQPWDPASLPHVQVAPEPQIELTGPEAQLLITPPAPELLAAPVDVPAEDGEASQTSADGTGSDGKEAAEVSRADRNPA